MIIISMFLYAGEQDAATRPEATNTPKAIYNANWVHVDGVRVIDKTEETRRSGKFDSKFYMFKIEKDGESIVVVTKNKELWTSMQIGTTLDLDYNVIDMSLGTFRYTKFK
jgi:hypothetical protein